MFGSRPVVFPAAYKAPKSFFEMGRVPLETNDLNDDFLSGVIPANWSILTGTNAAQNLTQLRTAAAKVDFAQVGGGVYLSHGAAIRKSIAATKSFVIAVSVNEAISSASHFVGISSANSKWVSGAWVRVEILTTSNLGNTITAASDVGGGGFTQYKYINQQLNYFRFERTSSTDVFIYWSVDGKQWQYMNTVNLTTAWANIIIESSSNHEMLVHWIKGYDTHDNIKPWADWVAS